MNARDPRTVCEMENMAADHDTLDRGCCMACALDASATHDRYVPTALSSDRNPKEWRARGLLHLGAPARPVTSMYHTQRGTSV